jgi:hypothetical protein
MIPSRGAVFGEVSSVGDSFEATSGGRNRPTVISAVRRGRDRCSSAIRGNSDPSYPGHHICPAFEGTRDGNAAAFATHPLPGPKNQKPKTKN